MTQPSHGGRHVTSDQHERPSHPPDRDIPDLYRNLDEIAVKGPIENRQDQRQYQYESLEDARSQDLGLGDTTEQGGSASDDNALTAEAQAQEKQSQDVQVSRVATQIYTVSYLILFSFLGTLARLGLQWLTNYPGAPVFPSVWFNFGGSVVMGFLAEDRMLFRHEWGTPTYEHQIQRARQDEESGSSSGPRAVDLAAAKKAHLATKKTIPLYIGLATGFCGSFTSFSSFMRDAFLAVSNDLTYGGGSSTTATTPRNSGYSFMALLAVVTITVTASLSGLTAGAHLAAALEPITPSLPFLVTRRVADRLAVFLAWACWAGAVVLAVIPPADYWRGVAVFSLVLAPLGTLARFYLALWLNGLRPAFPLGTFAANALGTAVLGMAWDLQHAPSLGGPGAAVGCQVLQGVEDGLCGCLTTVSTWVAELAGLRRRHAWVYGGASVVGGFAVMVAIMGGLRWSDGFAALKCVH
jgi:fluoride exporter